MSGENGFDRRQEQRRQEDVHLGDKLDRNWRWLILVLALLLLGGTAEFVAVQRANDRLNAAAVRQCERVQGLRDLVNYDNELMTNANLIVASVLAQKSLVKIISPLDATSRVHDTAIIQQLSDQMLTEMPTDCQAAVDHPRSYRPPKPTRIARGAMNPPRPTALPPVP